MKEHLAQLLATWIEGRRAKKINALRMRVKNGVGSDDDIKIYHQNKA
jgi:hypothetical protein